MTTNVTSLTRSENGQKCHSWRGKPLQSLTRKELEDALLEVERMYHGALEHIGQRSRVQLVPLEISGDAPLGWEAFLWGAILGSVGCVILMGVGVL